ncbi:unnamed protein product [Scytosiphon promiscuus]
MEQADELHAGGGRNGDPGGSGVRPASGQLATFAADFESNILRPVREKRAAGDEILAIQPVALGVVRDPELDGVIDGEVGGFGPIAESVQTFLHWVPIKLETGEALRLCVSCGDALSQEGEFACAHKFYDFVSETCEEITSRGRLVTTPLSQGTSVGARRKWPTFLARDEACWMARATFGASKMELRMALTRDPHVQFSATLTRVVSLLRAIQSGMHALLSLPKEEHDAVSWLVLEGGVLLFDWCEPLSVLGHGGCVVEFLVWDTLAMESMVSLSTVKHLPWRTRLAVATCYAFEQAGKPAAAAKCSAHTLEKTRELRRQEGMDPPVPPNVLHSLDLAEGDLRLLTFKYAALSVAVSRRPSIVDANGGNGGEEGAGATRNGTEGRGEDLEGGLSEEDLCGLLDEHISDTSQRPAALLELVGCAARENSASGVGALTAREASVICGYTVSLLRMPDEEQADSGEDGRAGGEGAVGYDANQDGPDAGQEQAGGSGGGGVVFPLDIEQEMQLMREMYRLGEFQAWGLMLPSTKQRLREASKIHLPLDESRAFWFEIALWTSRTRLKTWRDKPEPKQPAAKGGLKRTPPVDNGSSKTAANTGNRTDAGDDAAPAEKPATSCPSSAREGGAGRAPRAGSHESAGRAAGSVVVAAVEVEEELQEALLATRPSEVIDIILDSDSAAGARVNLTPMLTVVNLLRKALFGPYRHIFERRGEAVLDAALFLWEPYMADILKALDSMPGEAEIDTALLDALLLSLETISACLSALNADDEPLRATVALRLAIVQADFRGDRRKACQTLRGALAGIDKYRQSVVSHHLHHASIVGDARRCRADTTSSFSGMSLALSRASVSASFHGCSIADQGVGEEDAGVRTMAFHEVAALQLDILSTLFRVELLMGRDTASQLTRHQKAKAVAELAARKNASKRKKPSNKASKVTFGDSEGRSDTVAGSLAAGWSVTLPPDIKAGGNSRGCGGGVTKALTGTNAIVCAAGGGPLPTKAAMAVESARQNGVSLIPEASLAPDGRGPVSSTGYDGQVEFCPATEARLISEFRRNPYGRALLLATVARLRTKRKEQGQLLTEAAALLRQAKASENTLLGMIPPLTNARDDRGAIVAAGSAAGGSSSSAAGTEGRAPTGVSLPAPLLLSRSHSSVELLPYLFSTGRASDLQHRWGGGMHRGEALTASNGTSTSARAALSEQREHPTRRMPRIAKVCVYGKAEGAGTGVTLGNTHYAGLGVPIPFDEDTGVCGAVSVRGLSANESYVFAIAAFDEHGDPIGEGVGSACQPVETLNPLPLPLCWAHLSRTALGLGCPSLAAESAQEVYRELIFSAGATAANVSQERACNVRSEANGPPLTTTNLRDGWMGSPLLGQAFDPEALDRCPRGALQAFVQACFALVDTTDEDAMARAEAGGGAPLERQVCCLVALKRLSLACEVAVLLRDWDLVARGVWRAYHLLLPLLRVSAMGRLLFQIMCQLHQCLALVPKGHGWDAATKTTFACLAYQITIKGEEIGESRAARSTLLDNGPERNSELAVFKDPSPPQENVGEGEGLEADTPAQIALLEVWMGLPGYGAPAARVSEATADEAAADSTCTKLRKALELSGAAPAGHDSQVAEADGDVGGQGAAAALVSTSEAIEQVVSATHKDPSKGWELLQGSSFLSHPDRARLLCRVCWIALSRGMAQQVLSWLGSTTAGAVETLEGEAGGRDPFHLFAESDLNPLSAKVLALEGALQDLQYILPTSERKGSEARAEDPVAAAAATTDGNRGSRTGSAKSEGKRVESECRGTEAGPCKDLSCSSPDGEGEECCLDALSHSASGADCEQLLRLAEVEHILGAASLQLGLAAAPKTTAAWKKGADAPGETVPDAPQTNPAGATCGTPAPAFEPSRPSEAEEFEAAAGGRRPWGYGTGPFAQVLATKEDIFVESGGGGVGNDASTGATDGAEADEDAIIAQLEDDGTPWPTIDQMISSVTTSASDSGNAKDTSGSGEEKSRNKASGDVFALFLSRAMLHLTRAASRARWARSWVKTERACGLLWNTILSLWLSPQDFRLGGDTEAVVGRGLPLGVHHGRTFAKACEALLDAVDAPQRSSGSSGRRYQRSTDGSNPENAADDRSAHSDGVDDEDGDPDQASPDIPLPPDMRWVSRFVEWGLQGILRCRCWGVVVKVGSKMLASTGGLHGGNRVYPLALYAQKQLCSLASALLSRREARLQAMDDKFEAAQAKRRRRKVLKALEMKSKEELEHEREREPLLQAVGDARVRKQIHDHRLGTILQSRDTYAKTKKIGRRTLDDAREALAEHLALLSPPPPPPPPLPRRASGTELTAGSGDSTAAEQGRDGKIVRRGSGEGGIHGGGDDGSRGVADPNLIKGSEKNVLRLYKRAVDVLRDKRERELLAEALCDMGDLHALGGGYGSTAKCWTDAIDSLCSTLDSSKHWRRIFGDLRAAHPSSGGPPGGGGSLALALGGWSCLAGGTVLGKLSMYTGQTDMRGQLNLCLMAAEMFRAPLETSLPFPQRECDYASFTPETLGGPGLEGVGLWTDDRRLSAAALSLSLMHVQGVLTAAGCSKEAFPVQAILEHVASKVTLDPLQLVRAKLERTECLAKAGFPAEAASALAGVLSGGDTPKTTGGYAGRREAVVEAAPDTPPAVDVAGGGKGKDKKGAGAKGKGGGKGGGKAAAAARKSEENAASGTDKKSEGSGDPRHLAKSGLPFYGFAPYQNSLPLGHPDNAAAVSWLIGDHAGTGAVPEGDAAGDVTGTGNDGVDGQAQRTPRHTRLLKRGLSGAKPDLEELRGEREACTVALGRAHLLLALADCSAMEPSDVGEEAGRGEGGAAVLRRVRDAADCVLGEVLQVIFKRISPAAVRTPTPAPDTGRSGKSGGTHGSSSTVSADEMAVEAAEAAHIAATAPGQTDAWAPPMAAKALLMRGRLALLDGKLRVCRHHASRGLAVLLRHGLNCKSEGTSFSCPSPGTAALARRFHSGGAPLSSRKAVKDAADSGGAALTASAGVGGAKESGGGEGGGIPGLSLGDEQRQPWKVVQTWLELRHDLAVVALLQAIFVPGMYVSQGRTKDAIFQAEKGMEEAGAVGEAVISNRLRRLRAQAAVAEGQLEQAVFDCRTLAADYLEDSSASALDLAAVLRLLAKQSLVGGESDRSGTLAFLSEAVEALRIADGALLSDAKRLGWIGSGVLTYSRKDDNLMGEGAKPGLLHALGTCFRDLSGHANGEAPFGFAPSDEEDEVAQSSLANLYLPALRLLLTVRVSLLDTLEGVGQHIAEREGRGRQGGATGSTGSNVQTLGHQGVGEDDIETNAEGGGRGSWLDEASLLAEETLALLRHVAHPHPALRAHALLLVGRLRLRRLLSTPPALQLHSSAMDATAGSNANVPRHERSVLPYTTVHVEGVSRSFQSYLEGAAATALTAALRLSFSRGGHDGRVMIDACMCLVRLYSALSPGVDPAAVTSSREVSAVMMDEENNGAYGGDRRAAGGEEIRAVCFDEGERKRKLDLACHYLRLAAAISYGRKRLDVELDSISSEPLPPAVVENMPRSALDELAGRGGRGPEDDPLRLTTRGVLQFLRSRAREKSLAAAPTDLLPATAVCQIHALLYRHVPKYRDECCVQEASLRPPSSSVEGNAEQGEPSTVGAADLAPGTVCVQWIWGDHSFHPSDGSATSNCHPRSINGGGASALCVDKTKCCTDEQQVVGLYPARTAFILLAPDPPAVDGEGQQESAGDGGDGNSSHPPIRLVRMLATEADSLRRRASQLKILLTAFTKKRPIDTTDAAIESAGAPSTLEQRFRVLLQDVARVLRAGAVPLLRAVGTAEAEAEASALLPGRAEEVDLVAGAAVPRDGRTMDLNVENVAALEGVFDTWIGVDVENEQLCRFLRAAVGAAKATEHETSPRQ